MREKLICTFPGNRMAPPLFLGERNIVASTSQGVYHYCNGTLQTLINYTAAGLCGMRTRLIEGVLDPYLGDDGFQRPLLLNDKIYAFSAGRSHWHAVLDVFSQSGQHLSHKELTDIGFFWCGASEPHIFCLGYQTVYIMDTEGRILHQTEFGTLSFPSAAAICGDSVLFIGIREKERWLTRVWGDGTLETVFDLGPDWSNCPVLGLVASPPYVCLHWQAIEKESAGSAFYLFRMESSGQLAFLQRLEIAGRERACALAGGFLLKDGRLLCTDYYSSGDPITKWPPDPDTLYGRLVTASVCDQTYSYVRFPRECGHAVPAPVVMGKDGTVGTLWYNHNDHPFYILYRDGDWQAGPPRRQQYLLEQNGALYVCDVGGKASKLRLIQP